MRFKNIDQGNEFDWDLSSEEYAKYRDIYPPEYYEIITAEGLGMKGQKALDIGTGTGVIPRGMYKYGADWTGLDLAENQIAWAKKLSQQSRMNISYLTASAENSGLPDDEFDLITACQCFSYFDKSKLLPEVYRMLKPQGRFLILFMAWLPYKSEIAMGSEDIVRKYNPDWSGGYFKSGENKIPEWSKELFECKRCFSFEVPVGFTRENWSGRMYACRGVAAATISDDKKLLFKKDHEEYMKNHPATFVIPHWITVLDFIKK